MYCTVQYSEAMQVFLHNAGTVLYCEAMQEFLHIAGSQVKGWAPQYGTLYSTVQYSTVLYYTVQHLCSAQVVELAGMQSQHSQPGGAQPLLQGSPGSQASSALARDTILHQLH